MSNREFTATRTMLANAFATAGAELLAYMGSSSALAAIPETDPPKYVAAGPLDEIAKLLPAFDKPAAATVLTDERIDRAIMKSALFDNAFPTHDALHDFARWIEREALSLAGKAVAAEAPAAAGLEGLTRYGWTEAYIGDTSELVEQADGTYVKFADVERLLATQAQAAAQATDLHNAIMNIPCKRADHEFMNTEHRMLYKNGHRDARHAAAELALAHPAAAVEPAVEQAEPTIQGKTISGWYVAWCETLGKLKAAKACIGRYQKLVSDLEELSKPRQSVPDNIIHLIQDYGDARADDDRYAASKFGDTITAIRRLIASQAAPAAPEQVQAIPAGYKLVPLVCTPDMRAAWDRAPQSEDDDVEFYCAYRAMIDSAPSAAAPAAPSELSAEHAQIIDQQGGAPAGYKLVPIEPTDAMLAALDHADSTMRRVYRAMIFAAPAPAAKADQDTELLDWLNDQPVHFIELDDFSIIDVKGNDVRRAIRAAMSQAKGAGKDGAA